ncbi:MAG: PocR ligand-binding domain-containing protein, partial [Planctomycetota bacterium]|nr:PocR ligand-binding domain-containing protein [Planctomycetota bacterium]
MTELIARQEIEYLLGFGTPRELRSALTLVEAGPEGLPTRIDPGPEYPPSESPFCAFLRHGKLEGKLAFAGANRECERCEARLANRALTSGEISHSRCHLGLTDFAVPVVVRGRIVAAIVAGQCVEEDDQRKRITKTVGKIGKLTRGEVRSLEESGDRVAPAIQRVYVTVPLLPVTAPLPAASGEPLRYRVIFTVAPDT